MKEPTKVDRRLIKAPTEVNRRLMKKLTKVNRRIWRVLSNEQGSMESTLVIIPSVIVFLIVLQMALTVFDRNIRTLKAQEMASRISVLGYTNETAQEAVSKEIATSFVKMPSGKTLVVTHTFGTRALVSNSLSPIVGNKPINVSGFAVFEE